MKNFKLPKALIDELENPFFKHLLPFTHEGLCTAAVHAGAFSPFSFVYLVYGCISKKRVPLTQASWVVTLLKSFYHSLASP